jgi:hypothetical protein
MGRSYLGIQQKCEFRTIEQLQRGKQKIKLESKEGERLLKVAILKTEYTYSYN